VQEHSERPLISRPALEQILRRLPKAPDAAAQKGADGI
jgi:hypothetical protein